jgi:hypothetical protein
MRDVSGLDKFKHRSRVIHDGIFSVFSASAVAGEIQRNRIDPLSQVLYLNPPEPPGTARTMNEDNRCFFSVQRPPAGNKANPADLPLYHPSSFSTV